MSFPGPFKAILKNRIPNYYSEKAKQIFYTKISNNFKLCFNVFHTLKNDCECTKRTMAPCEQLWNRKLLNNVLPESKRMIPEFQV